MRHIANFTTDAWTSAGSCPNNPAGFKRIALFEHPSMSRPLSSTILVLAAGLLSGCASVLNEPINLPAVEAANAAEFVAPSSEDNATLIGLSFSGGGTRAAAFAYGVLKEMAATPLPGEGGKRNLIDAVGFVSGVSGGSVTAAYFGLKGPQGFQDYRETFLTQNAEEYLRTSVVRPSNLLRALSGGVNDRTGFARWLDEKVFRNARFGQMRRPGAPVVWINATDLYSRAPFIFEAETFRALCSDLNQLPLSEAVAASAAVPVAFAPIVLEAYGPRCTYNPPGWLETARHNMQAAQSLKNYARALENYRDPAKLKYVKLLDGGLADNFGVTGLTIARAASQTPYGPLTPRQAVRMKRMVYLVVNAGREQIGDWGRRLEGPSGGEFLSAVTDAMIESTVAESYDAFRMTMRDWQQQLIEYRCKLSFSEVKRLRGSTAGWDCRDLKFFIGQVAFDNVPDRQAALNQVPTSLQLPAAQVDLVIEAGREALRANPTFNGALRSMEGLRTAGKSRMTVGEAASGGGGGGDFKPDPR